jgi:putative nucleotidyltransferase-like protein
MHELPPMRHVTRLSVIDVHHAILPETARLRPNPTMLREAALPLGDENLKVLAPADMVLHSAVHLFHDGEFDNGLRDLVDLDLLLRHFATAPDFWSQLVSRAVSLELSRPLFYALRYTRGLLGTEVPGQTLMRAEVGRPSRGVLQLMDTLSMRGLRPRHVLCDDWLSAPTLGLLYVRAHWLRMPPLLLARHLLQKAFAKQDET